MHGSATTKCTYIVPRKFACQVIKNRHLKFQELRHQWYFRTDGEESRKARYQQQGCHTQLPGNQAVLLAIQVHHLLINNGSFSPIECPSSYCSLELQIGHLLVSNYSFSTWMLVILLFTWAIPIVHLNNPCSLSWTRQPPLLCYCREHLWFQMHHCIPYCQSNASHLTLSLHRMHVIILLPKTMNALHSTQTTPWTAAVIQLFQPSWSFMSFIPKKYCVVLRIRPQNDCEKLPCNY